ncbi:ABC transporter substrate-binding protein [Caldimonas thermodepolymerans]|jgi:ABC-type nitrate/sulfonate/bicarbonate transport systems, periplasmic components|uniref:Thiamine pyrimidine synthase n=1 Tax=Caldimonas thermodepolymerans TaxID=215580 RepID=A0A2S5T8Q0_9BURK|nr:ABC transporter substrate-binding protein [Caldimonas thermodepolymerans]PPE71326.1 taurine ABC transporter permease [Caldimonas thermodepolymerans]QPC32498.1 ABC transporter substrate-binding protein [Caldimonas thermodepolymerans]RDH98892.1 NitT/TauT family transport system substrate-binding protein [Caldimonas thermodepolymerans]TCP06290.1 NitT/TauT family transport system substrate-binding protein [Caldimonas thermodepolymerans]UZG49050.1 ABC transporter substrate-binding protein [Caldi
MTLSLSPRRGFLAAALAATCALAAPLAHAQETPIKFQLDWRFEGPSAFFLLPVAKGYFHAEKLAVTVDAGNGSGNAVNRVASGAYDMGFADMAALMEFHANNPTAPNKPVAVMMVYNHSPAAVFSLKKSGIKAPADLAGKKLGAPAFDAGRRAFPIFQKANGVGAVEWVSMEPALRETMLARGDVDAITGFYFTSLLNLEARGVKPADISVMLYPQHGVRMYGNAIIASQEFLKKNPEAVKAFLRAFTKGAREVIADPKAAIAYVKQRDGIINVALEERRLRLAIDSAVATPDARAEGFGAVHPPRLALMASQVADAFATKSRIDPDAVWTPAFLPPAAERDIFPAGK